METVKFLKKSPLKQTFFLFTSTPTDLEIYGLCYIVGYNEQPNQLSKHFKFVVILTELKWLFLNVKLNFTYFLNTGVKLVAYKTSALLLVS